MGYILTEQSIDQVAWALDEIMKAPIKQFEVNDAARFRYLLHQAIAAAKSLGYEPYDQLNVRVSQKQGLVIVTHKNQIQAKVVTTDTSLSRGAVLENTEAKDPLSVVSIVKAHPEAHVFHFPAFADNPARLSAWAEARGYEITDTEPLTITRSMSQT